MAATPKRVPRDRRLAVLGWSLAVVSLLMMATVPLLVGGGVNDRPQVRVGYRAGDYLAHLAIVSALVLPGAWLTQLRPRNAIGWILLLSGVLQATQTSTDAYGIRALTDPDHSLPLARTSEWFAQWTWIPSLLIIVAVLPVLYPSGRPPTPRWRLHLRVTVGGLVCLVAAAALASAQFDDSVIGAEAGYRPPMWLVAPLAVTGVVVSASCLAITLVGTVIRTVRARAPERQQLALLVTVVALMVPSAFVPGQQLFVVVYVMLPISVVIGVLRYRLLGIEVAVRRTLLYVPLTVLVAVAVGLTTASLARLMPPGPVPLLLASGIVAVFIFPVARILQRAVDRFVLGDRADPLSRVAGVSADISTHGSDPVSSMLAAITAATRATYGAVCSPDGLVQASVGTDHVPTHQVPLRLGADDLGTLLVGPRPHAARVEAADARLIDALAPHLAMVVHASMLTSELAEQQQRTAEATLAERDRLRRDLHDGLGPSLAGITLSLEAAQISLPRDPAATAAIIDRAHAEASEAAHEVRRVIDALRPSVLDQIGLAAAIRQTASGLGFGRPGGVRFTLRTGDLKGLSPLVEEAAYRISAESLTNVARHARARNCTVQLSQSDDALLLEIEDDGAGMPGATPTGHGLDSMERRASDLGGRFALRPGIPRGTVVDVVLPRTQP